MAGYYARCFGVPVRNGLSFRTERRRNMNQLCQIEYVSSDSDLGALPRDVSITFGIRRDCWDY